MITVQQLNTQFGIKGQLEFREDASGLVVADIRNQHASASLCLQGAHLMTWKPGSQPEPVIWLSHDAKLAVGKSIRGGVPVCWPWFGRMFPNPVSPDTVSRELCHGRLWKLILDQMGRPA